MPCMAIRIPFSRDPAMRSGNPPGQGYGKRNGGTASRMQLLTTPSTNLVDAIETVAPGYVLLNASVGIYDSAR